MKQLLPPGPSGNVLGFHKAYSEHQQNLDENCKLDLLESFHVKKLLMHNSEGRDKENSKV